MGNLQHRQPRIFKTQVNYFCEWLNRFRKRFLGLKITSHGNHNFKCVRERRQIGFVTLNGDVAVSGWVGLAYDR